jgi:cell division protein FtsW (lipid II flippase)
MGLLFRQLLPAVFPLLIFGSSLTLYIFAVSDYSYFFLVLSSLLCFFWWGLSNIFSSFFQEKHRFLQTLSVATSPFFITLGMFGTLHLCTVFIVPALGKQLYPDRINVWQNGSGFYPYAGYQVNQALRWVAMESAQTHAPQNVSTAYTDNRHPLTGIFSIPAVDDDFALTGWKASYRGILPKVTPLFALSCFIFGLLYLPDQLHLQTNGGGNSSVNDTSPFIELFIVGVVGFLVGNAYLSFSTNFQILPVMGQPFPFLGRQGSFLSLFMFPALWFITIYKTAISHEEYK